VQTPSRGKGFVDVVGNDRGFAWDCHGAELSNNISTDGDRSRELAPFAAVSLADAREVCRSRHSFASLGYKLARFGHQPHEKHAVRSKVWVWMACQSESCDDSRSLFFEPD